MVSSGGLDLEDNSDMFFYFAGALELWQNSKYNNMQLRTFLFPK